MSENNLYSNIQLTLQQSRTFWRRHKKGEKINPNTIDACISSITDALEDLRTIHKRLKLLEGLLTAVAVSHPWMLASILHKARETQGDNFSDDLKQSLATQELIEVL